MSNAQALHNVLTSIREVAAAKNTSMHKLIVQNPLAKSMSSKKCDELVSSETQKYVYEAARNVSNAVMCLQQLYSETCDELGMEDNCNIAFFFLPLASDISSPHL